MCYVAYNESLVYDILYILISTPVLVQWLYIMLTIIMYVHVYE